MSEEWIVGGGPSARPWIGGQRIDGMPGVRVGRDAGAGGRLRVMADGRARVVLVGDFFLTVDGEGAMLDAAANGRWSDLTRCPGSYWVVARNGVDWFVCGDLAGFRAVFHAGDGPRAVWSSSARRVAAHSRAIPDLALMAAQVAAGAEQWPDRTVYEGVFAVPGGFGLLLGGPRPRLVDVTGVDRVDTLTAGAAAFGAALETAVCWRVRDAGGVVGADVSGGLDSSSVAILAARTGEVRAVTYSDPYTSREDLAFARRVAEYLGVALEVGLGGPTQLPFAWSPSQPMTDQPVAASLTMGQHLLYLQPVVGLPLHLTGNGGDVVLDSSSAVWSGMVQTGERRTARRLVTNWARARNRAPRDLWRAVTKTAAMGHAGALEEAAVRMETGGFDGRRVGVWSWCHLGLSGTWLTSAGRQQVAVMLRDAARAAVPVRADLAEQQASLRLNGADARDTGPLAAAWGVRPVHPYLDNQVVRAAFAIAPAERHGVTTFKPLLAAGLPDLPTWLTGRCSKGSFTRHLLAGMLRHQRELAHLIRTSALVTSGLLDPEPAVAALAGVSGVHAGALYDLQRLVMACQWLAAHGCCDSPPLEEAC